MTALRWPPAGAECSEGGDPRGQDSKHINSACLDPRCALASHVQATLYKYKWKGQRDRRAFESQMARKKAAAICMQRLLYGVAKQKGLTRSKWEATDLSVLWKWCIIAPTRFASASCGGLSISLSTRFEKRESFDSRGPFCFLTRGPWWHVDFLRICSFVTGVWILCRLKLTKLILYFKFEQIHSPVLIRH